MGFEEAFQAADLAVRSIRVEGLRDIERVVLEGSWNRQTYQKIALEAGYTEGYLSRDVGPALWTLLSDALGMQVKKTNFRTAIERWSKQQSPQLMTESSPLPTETIDFPTIVLDGGAPPIDVTDFRGRHDELAELTNWILHDRGRLLCLFGKPGVGKTWLAVKLTHSVQANFQRVIYRDLDDQPTPLDLTLDLLESLQSLIPPEPSLSDCLELLVKVLAQQNTLIVLDGTEVFCRPGAFAGTYETSFEDYAQVLETLATYDHQSCIFWVGRALPRSSAHVAGSSCRLHQVNGLNPTELSELTFWPTDLSAMDDDWQHLHNRYGGVLSLMQSIVPRLAPFGNNLAACLTALQQESQLAYPYLQRQQENQLAYSYLEVWLAPLSETEWSILTWLTISQRPLSLKQLSQFLGISMPLAAIESLCERGICRSVVQENEPHWELMLADLVAPYVCDHLLEVFQSRGEPRWMDILHRYPLLQADAPEIVRQWQKRTILETIANLMAQKLPHNSDRQAFLQRALQISRQRSLDNAPKGYSAGNLINLAQQWHISLVSLNCQRLVLQGADLQADYFQGVTFTGSDLSQTVLARPLGQSPVIALSPDQLLTAVGDQDGRLLLWNLRDGRLQRAMLNITEAIEAVAFSEDGRTLAEGRQDGRVRLWDLQSEYVPESFVATAGSPLRSLVFSPNKQFLVGGDEAGYLHVWRLASGEQIHRIQAHEGAITALAVSPESRWLITCGQDCAAMEWNLETGESKHRFQGRLTNWLGTVAYLPTLTDSGLQAVVVGRDDGQVVIWDIASARPLRVMTEVGDMVMALVLSANGRYLAVSDVRNTLAVWDVSTRSRLYEFADLPAPIASMVFSPDNKELITGCDYTVQRWQVKSGQCLQSWRSDSHPAIDLVLAAHPLQLLSSHDDQTLRCWQPTASNDRWTLHERLQVPGGTRISAIAVSPHGGYWVIGTEAGTVHIWRCQEKQWHTLSIYLSGSITALALNADETALAVGDTTGTIAVWHMVEDRFCWQQPQSHADKITALVFAADGRLFSGSRDRTVQGKDQEGNQIANLTEHRRRVHTLCCAADGKTLYSGSYDGTVRCWDLTTQTCTRLWQQGDRLIHCIVQDADNCPLVIVSDTQTLEIWELDTDTQRVSLPSHQETIWHVSTSPDGQWLISASQEGEINLWQLNSGEQQVQLRVDRPYEGMQIGHCTGLSESERLMLHSLGATDY
ncbi:MAG: AAA family ATPase [Cyanobacteria bacterium J06639_14]